jgi:GNAT superfamily N-acetyltransferase
MTDTRIRPMVEADVAASITLALGVFDKFVANDCTPEGVASFREWAAPTALADRLRTGAIALVAEQDEQLVGLVEFMGADHLAMLFVDPAVQGEGVGRRLFEEALRRADRVSGHSADVRVHASRYAVPFYRRLGFRETGPERDENGIRYVPMTLTRAA